MRINMRVEKESVAVLLDDILQDACAPVQVHSEYE